MEEAPGAQTALGVGEVEDGLALSSRNVRLTPEHRAAAPSIHRLLVQAAAAYADGAAPAEVCADVRNGLNAIDGVRIDYVELVDAENLHAVTDEARPALLAVAAFFGDVRLIDNIELSRNV